MAFSPSEMRKFTERNVAFGERGADRRRKQLSDYANMLQGIKNQGDLDFQAGAQEFQRPEQAARIGKMGAETEGFQLGNEGERFYQGLAKQYGPTAMRQSIGMAEPISRANWSYAGDNKSGAGTTDAIQPSDVASPGLRPKYGISSDRPSRPPGLMQEFADTYDQVSESPMGRALDMGPRKDALNYFKDAAGRIGEGMERGLGIGFKQMLTPRKRTKKEKEQAARPFGIGYYK